MISICIPVYNNNVVLLVQELSKQLNALGVAGEIIVFDDDSEPSHKLQNSVLPGIAYVHYKELSQNVGRTGIRKLLAESAQFPLLLFLDGDSIIISERFLYNYCNAIQDHVEVLTGGRIYSKEPPIACLKRLHWKYGTNREATKGRLKALHTNNFLIRKKVFQTLMFPAYLKGYGHEDTWMQMELVRKGTSIKHIENPLLHGGLEETNNFLQKTDQASKNLVFLASSDDKALLRKHSALYNTFFILSHYRLTKLFCHIFRIMERIVLVNLNSCKPSLFYLDMWKLYRLIEMSKQHRG